MPDQKLSPAGQKADGGERGDASPAAVATSDLTREQIERWTQLVAEGQEAVPQGLSPPQELQMIQRVRSLRRPRLVRYIALQIALDLHRDRPGQ